MAVVLCTLEDVIGRLRPIIIELERQRRSILVSQLA